MAYSKINIPRHCIETDIKIIYLPLLFCKQCVEHSVHILLSRLYFVIELELYYWACICISTLYFWLSSLHLAKDIEFWLSNLSTLTLVIKLSTLTGYRHSNLVTDIVYSYRA